VGVVGGAALSLAGNRSVGWVSFFNPTHPTKQLNWSYYLSCSVLAQPIDNNSSRRCNDIITRLGIFFRLSSVDRDDNGRSPWWPQQANIVGSTIVASTRLITDLPVGGNTSSNACRSRRITL
jgi:hypothetical protein